ncbi:MAG: DUF4838 domain-containing protein, partial [Verrucomicrobia bacterium]|nr:DUF4838 domain-containing protein [Verrucomicrobiota bacterium]
MGLLSVGLASACLFFLLMRHYALLETERWFVPGELGHERGRRATYNAVHPDSTVSSKAPLAGARSHERQRVGTAEFRMDAVRAEPRQVGQAGRGGFLTRALGVDAGWGRHNHLTKPLAFSHNLGHVFPPDLARDRPEFFPLADGRRLQPPTSGAWFWNPDLGRPDVALHAADAARKYFVAHPDAPSFALGVNDALIWGESPELLSLTSSTEPTAEDPPSPGYGAASRGQRTEVGPVGPKWFRERPDYSNLVFTFMNRAAEELSRTHPQKYLGALAYYWAENAPDFPLHPQVIPFLTADRAQGYDRDFRAEEFQLQERWALSSGVGLPLAGRPEAGPATSADPTSQESSAVSR